MFKNKKTKRKSLVLLLIILCILFSSTISINANDPEKPATINETRIYGKGELRIVEGIPFVRLAGSYYEMGEQYGVLLKERIKSLYEGLMNNPEWVSYAQQSKELAPQLEKLLSPRFTAYLKGMAAGSQVEYDILLLGSFASLGCSSILKKIDSGGGQDRLLHARNLDAYDSVKSFQGIFEFQPEGELKYIAMGTIGLRIEDGLNERGISISVNDGDGPMRYKLPRYPLINTKMMDILSSAASLADVDKQMTGYASDIGAILIIGSTAEKDGVIYDISYEKLRKNPMAGKEYLFVTNTYLHPDLTSPKDLLKCPRYQIIDNYMKQGRVKTVDDLIDLLGDPGTLYGVNNFRTMHSVIYDSGKKIIYLAVANGYAAWGKWLRYDWQKDQITVCPPPAVPQSNKTQREVEVNADVYDDYIGKYELQPGLNLVISMIGNHLMAQATGQIKFELYPEEEDVFFAKITKLRIIFVRSKEGNVFRLRLLQADKDISANKIE